MVVFNSATAGNLSANQQYQLMIERNNFFSHATIM